jgi:hypothetical protein
MSSDFGYEIKVNVNSTTGLPSFLNSNSIPKNCDETYSFVQGSATGFVSNSSSNFTEAQECVYEYNWTPTASEKSFAIIDASNSFFRCGDYGTTLNPLANGPSSPATCLYNYLQDEDFPWFPFGLIEGQSYKVTFDVRLGKDAARISVSEWIP